MSRTHSDRSVRRRLTVAAALVLAAGLASPPAARPLAAQQAAATADVVSSEISVSREAAALRLEMADGRSVRLSLHDGAAWIDGQRIGDAPRGGDLDREWRALLNRGMDVTTAEFAGLAMAWTGPGSVGARMSQTLARALSADAAAADALVAPAVSTADSVDRLLQRIAELEARAEAAQSRAERASARESRTATRAERVAPSRSPFRHIARGISGVFSMLITYTILFAIGVAVIFFGGRRYIEGVADTARNATTRSLFVGLAATFLVVPAFVLGIIALAISIIGIPGLLVWIPGFPLAVVLGALLGYLGVAHASGEALAERRYYVTDWFQRGNSYYFLMTGLGLLLSFFIAGFVVQMGGPWLGVVRGLLTFFGVVATFLAVMVGFGAVLISRAGTRPIRGAGHIDEADLYAEEAGV